MKKNAKQIVHELYNDISISKDPKYSDILEVLQKVYLKLEKQKYELDPSPLINRLVNYLYFTAYTNKIRFTEYQEELIRNLSEIGRTESSPQSCVKVQPHQKHNVLRCEPNCHAFLSEERGQEQ